MAKKSGSRLGRAFTAVILLLCITLIFYFLAQNQAQTPSADVAYTTNDTGSVGPDSNASSNSTITIASWNLQVFGEHKAENATLLEIYASVIRRYDIVFVQEIRDQSGLAFPKLCSRLPGYVCQVSTTAGRSQSKEQYGVIYRKGIVIIGWHDFNPDSLNRWERPPLEVVFNVSGYVLNAYIMHVKPDDAGAELSYLSDAVPDAGNSVVMGDLNADCSYYNHAQGHQFSEWHWVIPDNEDTTVAATNCAYDRIIVNDNAYRSLRGYGVDRAGMGPGVSDHYLVWAALNVAGS